MIAGIGCDIIEIDRIKDAMKRKSFLEKLFTEREMEYLLKKNLAPETVAGSFAAKEAVSKALGTGISGFSFRDIEILHDWKGRPYAVLSHGAKELLESFGKSIFVSISHSTEYAVAYAVIEG